MRFNSTLAILLATTCLASGVALAADTVVADTAFEARFEGVKPAVSGFNGKVSLGYTYFNISSVTPAQHIDIYDIEGSLSLPLGQRFGLQVDAAVLPMRANGASATFYGAGAHLFWRNPDFAMAGIYGEVSRIDPLNTTFYRVGAEGEVYLGNVSLEAFAGVQGASGTNQTLFTGDLTAAFYATEDLRFDASVIRNFDTTWGRVGVEYQADFNGVRPTLYANASFGNGFQAYKAGVRFYFGADGNKSLMRRHREDDPRSRIDQGAVGALGLLSTPALPEACPQGTFDDGEGNCIPFNNLN